MTLLRWNISYSVDQQAIDDQHQELLRIFNQLHNAFLTGEKLPAMRSLFVQLIEIAGQHFSDEEALMARLGYPQLGPHRTTHNALLERLNNYLPWLDETSPRPGTDSRALFLDLFYFVRDWLDLHMKIADQDYAKWIAEHKDESPTGQAAQT